MGPKVNFTNTGIGRIGKLADVPKGSSAEISFHGGSVEEISVGLVERDLSPLEVLSNLLKDLGIEQDAAKKEAFKELVLSVKEKCIGEEQVKEEVKKSKLLTLLNSSERVINAISSAVTVATAIGVAI